MKQVSHLVQTPMNFPVALEDRYFYHEQLLLPKCTYNFAVYIDNENNEYIAKTCNKSDLKKLRELVNEDLMYKALWSISDLAKLKLEVSFANHYLTYEDSDTFLILLKKADGSTLRQLPIKVRIKSLQKTFKYLDQLYNVAEKEDTYVLEAFKKRYGYQFVLMTPFMTILAIIKNPANTTLILKAFYELLKYSGSVLKTKDYGFVHKDLNTSNIILHENKLTIIDLQLFCISVKAHDFANTFYSMWESDYQLDMALFLAETISNNKNSKEYKFFLFYSVLFDMSFGSNRIYGKAPQFIKFLSRLI